MDFLCHDCVIQHGAVSGRACYGIFKRHGTCQNCKRSWQRLFEVEYLSPAVTPLPVLRRHERYSPAPIWFGWSLVLLAVGIALAAFLLSREASPAERPRPTLEEFCQTSIRRLPVYFEDRAPELAEAKEAQLSTIARAVARRSVKAPLPGRQWAALLLTIGYHESTFSLRIHRGECRPKECDRGRARGPWQTHQNAFNRELWPKLHGIENVEEQARAADQLLRRVVHTCRSNAAAPQVPGILTAYAGRRCFQDWPGLGARLVTWESMRP